MQILISITCSQWDNKTVINKTPKSQDLKFILYLFAIKVFEGGTYFGKGF